MAIDEPWAIGEDVYHFLLRVKSEVEEPRGHVHNVNPLGELPYYKANRLEEFHGSGLT